MTLEPVRNFVRMEVGMYSRSLDRAVEILGPIPAAFRFGIDVGYHRWRSLCATEEGFADYTVLLHRRFVHEEAWRTVRSVLADHGGCEFLVDQQSEVLHFHDDAAGAEYKVQMHKVNDLYTFADNGTKRQRDILGQSSLWDLDDMVATEGVPWLTVGHRPNAIGNAAEGVVVGVAIEGGMSDYRRIDPAADIVASISSGAAEIVRRYRDSGAA